MLVRGCIITCGPKCLRWKLLIKSGHVAGEFLMLLMMCLVFCGENSVKVWKSEKLWRQVSESGRVCERKLRVNVGKRKVMRCSRYGNRD